MILVKHKNLINVRGLLYYVYRSVDRKVYRADPYRSMQRLRSPPGKPPLVVLYTYTIVNENKHT
jgi:hypothetical protein